METTRKRWKSTSIGYPIDRLRLRSRLSFLFLTLTLTLALGGCAHTVEITDQTVQAGKMKAGQSYTAPMDGWFVSDEGVAKILQAIEYYKYKWQECEEEK